MPARTNDFQQIVALIEQALAPTGAKITQSAMLKVVGLETLREVDVLVDGKFGPYRMKVAIEAKDHGKKIALPTFESILGKYRGEGRVAVDKIVIVSSRGFTEGVIEKAAFSDVELLTLQEAKEKNWNVKDPSSFSWKVQPHIHFRSFVPALPVLDQKFAYTNGRVICPHGQDHGTVYKWLNCFFFHRWVQRNKEAFKAYEAEVNAKYKGNALLNSALDMPPNWNLRFGGHLYPFNRIEFSIHFVNEQGPVTHRRFERHSSKGKTHNLHHIVGSTKRMKMSLTFAEGERRKMCLPDGREIVHTLPEKIVINFGKADEKSREG